MKYAFTEPQVALLREIAAASTAVSLPPASTQTAWVLQKRGLIKRTCRGSSHVAVVTADGRYYLKHGKHPREVEAEKERLEGHADQAARAPGDGAGLISRLRSASGKITVPDPAAQTRGGDGRPSQLAQSLTAGWRIRGSAQRGAKRLDLFSPTEGADLPGPMPRPYSPAEIFARCCSTCSYPI